MTPSQLEATFWVLNESNVILVVSVELLSCGCGVLVSTTLGSTVSSKNIIPNACDDKNKKLFAVSWTVSNVMVAAAATTLSAGWADEK